MRFLDSLKLKSPSHLPSLRCKNKSMGRISLLYVLFKLWKCENPIEHTFCPGLKKIHGKDTIKYFFSLFRHLLKLWKSMPVYQILFILLYEKRQKNDITQKTSNMQDFPFFTWLQHMSHLWTKHICNESLVGRQYPYIFSLDPKVYTPPPGLVIFPFRRSYVITYKSLLFCKSCFPCHFWCRAFVQRLLLLKSVSMLTFSMSPTYLEQVSVWSLS